MLSPGLLASSQRRTIEPPSKEPILVLQHRAVSVGTGSSPSLSAFNSQEGSTIIVAAAIRDNGPSLIRTTDSAENTYIEINRVKSANTSVMIFLYACLNARANIGPNAWISFVATYDDPPNNYPLPNGVSYLEVFEFSGIGQLEDSTVYLGTDTPVSPPETVADEGDLVVGLLGTAVTSRVWTPENDEYSYPPQYRGGNMTVQTALSNRFVAGPTAPSWSRSGTASNSSLILGRFSPKVA